MEIILGIIGFGIITCLPATIVILFDDIYQNKLKYEYPWDSDTGRLVALAAWFFVTCFTIIALGKIGEAFDLVKLASPTVITQNIYPTLLPLYSGAVL